MHFRFKMKSIFAGGLLQPLNMEALTAYEAQNGMNGKGAGRTDPERSMAEKDAVEVKGVMGSRN